MNMHAKQFVTSNPEYTHAPHQLGHETKSIKFQVVLLLEKNSDVAKKSRFWNSFKFAFLLE